MADAHEFAKRQRDISIAEFFEKNRHLLGFDNKRKALLTTIKEAVDNSLDACEDARVFPEVKVEINEISEFRYSVVVEDNGPGILKTQIPKVFAKLLYGSKFFKLSQSLAGDESIIARIDGKTRILPIGELIDKHVSGEGEARVENIEVPSFDWKNYQYSFMKASSLIKHKRQHDLYKINTAYGRSIKVTGCHSLFTLNKDLEVREVEAKDLKKGDFIVAPKSLPYAGSLAEINVLDYISASDVKGNWWYVYNIPAALIRSIIGKAEVVEKVVTKRKRRFYRFMDVEGQSLDILEDSVTMSYLKKGFLPLQVILRLGLNKEVENCVVRTYFHGKICEVPVRWQLDRSFMRFLGLFVAEGHSDSRQVGFTFGDHEPHLVAEIRNFAERLGLNTTLERRPERKSLRLKVFGGMLSYLLGRWCGRGAAHKAVPDFIFEAKSDLRQHFIDAAYQGDGPNTKRNNQLMHSTVSEKLAQQLNYLWLMNGAVASTTSILKKGLGKHPSKVFVTTVYGSDISLSKLFKPTAKHCFNSYKSLPPELFSDFSKIKDGSVNPRLFDFLRAMQLGVSEEQRLFQLEILTNAEFGRSYSKEELMDLFLEDITSHSVHNLVKKGYLSATSSGYLLTDKAQKLLSIIDRLDVLNQSDICLLEVTGTECIKEGCEYVYDISVPGRENFVAAGLSCHNSRGQQGLGISAAILYAQLTTGKAAKITSRISARDPAYYYELHIDVKSNMPKIIKEDVVNWKQEHGTRIELTLEAEYLKGPQSVDEYIRQTAIINPHVTLTYTNPKAEQFVYTRAADNLPPLPQEIKPHPYGIELGLLMRMLESTSSRTLQSFLMTEFSRVGSGTAKEICGNAALLPGTKPREISRESAEKLIQGIKSTKIIAPPADCISPIGSVLLERGLKKEVEAEFYCSTSRPPSVYRGNPFVVEASIAYGGKIPADRAVTIMRFANRVPLLYQQGACAITEALTDISWRPYGLQQSGSSIPLGPAVIVVHMASVWVPFTSEAKEALAHYPEILREVKLALQECGRKLGIYVNRKVRVHQQLERANLFERYIPEVADSLSYITGSSKEKIAAKLRQMLNREEIRSQLEMEVPEDETKE
ncbi:DNA topoisomerase VI subunit B [Candidatus Woesearchaeota archaeon]|nr:DNA topoisomerase VI subunit B [Candidatus Woesearchaeota archaeon]